MAVRIVTEQPEMDERILAFRTKHKVLDSFQALAYDKGSRKLDTIGSMSCHTKR